MHLNFNLTQVKFLINIIIYKHSYTADIETFKSFFLQMLKLNFIYRAGHYGDNFCLRTQIKIVCYKNADCVIQYTSTHYVFDSLLL